jgi:predicted lipoprotein with Yx(FWY)xxD motif
MKKLIVSAALGVLALAASACGGASGGAAPGSSVSGTARMVSVKHVDGVGNVLVDAKGQALYSPDQEAGGKVRCTGSCTSIWVPLTLSGSTNRQAPRMSAGISERRIAPTEPFRSRTKANLSTHSSRTRAQAP